MPGSIVNSKISSLGEVSGVSDLLSTIGFKPNSTIGFYDFVWADIMNPTAIKILLEYFVTQLNVLKISRQQKVASSSSVDLPTVNDILRITDTSCSVRKSNSQD